MATDYVKEMQYALASKNSLQALELVQKALVEEADNELLCANLIMFVAEFQLPCMEFIQQFLKKHPDSLYPIRVYLAEILCQSGNFDDCASEARYYLKLIKAYGKEGQTEDAKLREHNLKSYLLSTTVYLAAGARSYAKRIFEEALSYATPKWAEIYSQELATIDKELEDEKLAILDAKWEAFFQNGDHYAELYQMCAENRYTELAIRLRLLKTEFDTPPETPITEKEFLRVVMVSPEGDCVLSS